MNKRSVTLEQKKQINDRILKAWLQQPELRLGQLIFNSADDELFYIEDEDLLSRIERFCDH